MLKLLKPKKAKNYVGQTKWQRVFALLPHVLNYEGQRYRVWLEHYWREVVWSSSWGGPYSHEWHFTGAEQLDGPHPSSAIKAQDPIEG